MAFPINLMHKVLIYRLLLVFLFAISGGISACSNKKNSDVVVFAAASLSDAFVELEQKFESSSDINIVWNFAASSTLRMQIENGAPTSIFASANFDHMQAIVDAGLADKSNVTIFAKNSLGYIVPIGKQGGIEVLEDLTSENIRIVMAQAEVPAGGYALQALERLEEEMGMDFKANAIENVVSFEDSVRQVLLKVELGEADVGFVYQSDGQASELVEFTAFPDYSQPEIEYFIGLPNLAKDSLNTKAFLEFILSAEGQSILNDWGFISP
jgi:molybdate transport system substrate-binding protein